MPRKPTDAPAAEDQDELPPNAALALIPIAFFSLAASSLFNPSGLTYSYSVSSYSQTIVQTVDGAGQPKYETKEEQRFETNIPGLAERMVQRDQKDGTLRGGVFP